MVIDPAETTITDEQAEKVEEWLRANARVPGWLDGYPLGGAYIDLRARSGATLGARQAYVDLDHATARAVPELRGRHAQDIRVFLQARQEASPAPRM